MKTDFIYLLITGNIPKVITMVVCHFIIKFYLQKDDDSCAFFFLNVFKFMWKCYIDNITINIKGNFQFSKKS